MQYAVRNNELVPTTSSPPALPADADVARAAHAAALALWQAVAECEENSNGFRAIARANAQRW
jgi:hypothetical protein